MRMCNHYRMAARRADVANMFGVDLVVERGGAPAPDLTPGEPAIIIRRDGKVAMLDTMIWSGARVGGDQTCENCRTLWSAMLAQPEYRCLVPATGFRAEAENGETHWFGMADRAIFAMCGIWWPADGTPRFALLGTDETRGMPVILDGDDQAAWLNGSLSGRNALARPRPAELLEAALA